MSSLYIANLEKTTMRVFAASLLQFLDDHQYIFLIGSIVLMLVIYPFALESGNPSLWVHILLSLILATGLFAATTHEKFLKTSVFLGLFTFLFSWLDYALFEDSRARLLYLITGFLFFIFITFSLIRTIQKDKKVDSELIFGSIAGYMMIGLLSTFVFSIIQRFDPLAFSTAVNGFASFPEMIYFSFVNLTTLGYGDIIPLSPHAQSWSILFTIAGQMYMIILIGVIIGRFIKKEFD